MLNVAEVRNKTGIGSSDIDNLVYWDHIVPARAGRRRMFDRAALCQMRLYSLVKGTIPPTVACEIGALIPNFLDDNPHAEIVSAWSEGGKWKLGKSVPLELMGLEFRAAQFRELMVPK